jgi:hypothetical protein
MTEFMTMAEVVRRLRTIPRHQIAYALDRGFLKEPAKISGRRMFTSDDVCLIEAHFNTKKEAPDDIQR